LVFFSKIEASVSSRPEMREKWLHLDQSFKGPGSPSDSRILGVTFFRLTKFEPFL
jgi:hypothetical protein